MLPLVIGHRGMVQFGHENTLCAVNSAANFNIHAIEVDARLTKDEKTIVFHDDTIELLNGEKGFVKDFEYKKLSAYKTKIPLLKDIIKLCSHKNIFLNIEIKATGDNSKCQIICKEISTHSKPESTIISSYNIKVLETAQYIIPDFERMYIVDKIPSDWLSLLKKHKCKAIAVSIAHNTLDEIIHISLFDYPIYVFTVNDRDTFNILTYHDIGVITDFPYTLSKYK